MVTSTSRATAVLLPGGTTVFAVPETPVIGGMLLAGSVPVPVSSPAFSGTLTSSVISGDGNNGVLGGLTFVYTLTNDAGSAGPMDRMTINGFSGFITDSGYVLPGVAPDLNDRSASGDVIGFTFIGPPIGIGVLLPGQSSAQLIVRTDALDFTSTLASVIDGNVATVASFAPKPHNVPEPSTLALATLGLFGPAAWGWRGRTKKGGVGSLSSRLQKTPVPVVLSNQ
ncbi:MAG: PEP-CTERM sorting domain-containing protein [Planctomycetia bacterium]|nr:PEP-CTERM sorting domain-containing protein [Planctomycetia bacterium]